MKVTVNLSESEVIELHQFTGQFENKTALRTFVSDALMLRRRETLAAKFVSGAMGVELSDYQATRKLEHSRKSAAIRQKRRLSKSTLAQGYKATAARDRKMAAQWSELTEAWPEK